MKSFSCQFWAKRRCSDVQSAERATCAPVRDEFRERENSICADIVEAFFGHCSRTEERGWPLCGHTVLDPFPGRGLAHSDWRHVVVDALVRGSSELQRLCSLRELSWLLKSTADTRWDSRGYLPSEAKTKLRARRYFRLTSKQKSLRRKARALLLEWLYLNQRIGETSKNVEALLKYI